MMSKAELARKAGLSTLTIDRVEAGDLPPRHQAQDPARARLASPTRTACSGAGGAVAAGISAERLRRGADAEDPT